MKDILLIEIDELKSAKPTFGMLLPDEVHLQGRKLIVDRATLEYLLGSKLHKVHNRYYCDKALFETVRDVAGVKVAYNLKVIEGGKYESSSTIRYKEHRNRRRGSKSYPKQKR